MGHQSADVLGDISTKSIAEHSDRFTQFLHTTIFWACCCCRKAFHVRVLESSSEDPRVYGEPTTCYGDPILYSDVCRRGFRQTTMSVVVSVVVVSARHSQLCNA